MPRERWIRSCGQWLPWLALGCAFSPVLMRLTRAIPNVPFGWSALLALLLLARAWRCNRGTGEIRRGWGAAVIGCGLAVQLIGLAGDSWSIATAGLPIAVIGLALWTGAPPLVTAALACWIVPVPKTAFSLTTPGVENALAHLGATVGALFGAEVHASGPLIKSGAVQLQLDPYHNGLHLAVVAALLGWFCAARRAAPLAAAMRYALGSALAALPLQIPAVLVGVLLLACGAPGLASMWLDDGVWMVAAALGVFWVEGRGGHATNRESPQP